MDREYLENYEQKEQDEYEKLVERKIRMGEFSFEKDRYPPDERFVNLQKPIASCFTVGTVNASNLWAQVPFSGSLILSLAPFPKPLFEETYFKTSEISNVIDFIKETGRLQVALSAPATEYEGLDYLDPFFKQLSPPGYSAVPDSVFGSKKQIQTAINTFHTLARVKYLEFLREICQTISSKAFPLVLTQNVGAYIILKLLDYRLVDDIENLMVDDPRKAFSLLLICRRFIVYPIRDLRANTLDFTLEEIRSSKLLPLAYQPNKIQFPCEIGKFLLKKLTYIPQGLRACYGLIDHYDEYDLRKVQECLNEAIATNHPDIINKSTKELSEILDNVWNDPTIPKRVKGLKIGIPVSVAAIGGVVGGLLSGPVGVAAGGFLANLGFKVAEKVIDIEAKGLSEKLAKLRTKSYQANMYDFKKKYKAKIAHP